MEEKISLPQGVDTEVHGDIIIIKKQNTEVRRTISNPLIRIKKEGQSLLVISRGISRKHKRILNTIVAHLNNMILGSQQPFIYKVKVCSGHFPITVKKEGDYVVISNFLGEKIPRMSRILPGVTVHVEKDLITISSANKESAGQTAANLERTTFISKRDRRVFQDGCYIVEKPERVLSKQ